MPKERKAAKKSKKETTKSLKKHRAKIRTASAQEGSKV